MKKNQNRLVSVNELNILQRELSTFVDGHKAVLIAKTIVDDRIRVLLLSQTNDHESFEISGRYAYLLVKISYQELARKLANGYPSVINIFEDYIIIKDENMQLDVFYMYLSSLSAQKNSINSEGHEKERIYDEINSRIEVYKTNRNQYNQLLLIRSLIDSLLMQNTFDMNFDSQCSSIFSLVKAILNDSDSNGLIEEFRKQIRRKGDNMCLVSLFFKYNDTYDSFIRNIFLELCKPLKNILYYSSIIIYKKYDYRGHDGVAVCFVTGNNIVRSAAMEVLQRAIFLKIPECKLSCIDFISTPLSNRIKEKVTSEIFGKLTEDLLQMNFSEILTDAKSVTLFIYYYITAIKLFYSDNEIFISKNKMIFKHFVNVSLSNFTSGLVFNSSFSLNSNKLNAEYSQLYIRMAENISDNYSDVLTNKNMELSDFDYLSSLLEIRDSNYADIEKDEYFISFIQQSMDIFFLPNYYKAFVPFVVNKYYEETI
jgi:hypothetical protein